MLAWHSYVLHAIFFTPTWNEPIGAWFEKYTNEAAIDRHEFSVLSYNDKDGNTCTGSEADCTITFYLRNPKNYDLKPTWTTNNSSSTEQVLVIQDASDRSIIRRTIPQAFLLACEQNNKDDERNISPTIHIAQHENGTKIREFADYSFNLFANSKPPELLSPTVLNDESDSNDQKFVVAFRVPHPDTLKARHQDIKTLTIAGGGKSWDFDLDKNEMKKGVFKVASVSSNTLENFDNEPADRTWIPIHNKSFPYASDGLNRYFVTDISSSGDIAFTLTLSDSSGLTSTVAANTSIPKLSSPEILYGGASYSSGDRVFPDDGKDTATFTIKAQAQDVAGAAVGDTVVRYKLHKNNVVSTQQGTESVTLSLEEGTYQLESWSEKSGYEKSDIVALTVIVSSDMYVSSSGNDNDPGTQQKPFASLLAAIGKLVSSGNSNKDYSIHIDGTITNTAATINAAVKARSVTIEGVDKDTAVLQGSSSDVVLTISDVPVNIKAITIDGNKESALIIDGVAVTAEQVTITNSDNNNAVTPGVTVKSDGGAFTMKTGCKIEKQVIGVEVQSNARFVMEDGEITECASDSGGAGVTVDQNGTFTMVNGSIHNNTANGPGAGVKVQAGSFTMSGGAIYGNTAGKAAGEGKGGGVYVKGCTFTMSGGAIYSNTAGRDGSEGKGGGVYVEAGTLFIYGNAVIGKKSNPANGNTALGNGGGVHLDKSAKFTMSGGSIIGNSAENGGGVSLAYGALFTMTGGTIGGSTAGSQNKNSATANGGGVYMSYADNVFTMSGSAKICGNEAEEGGGVCVANGTMYLYGSATIGDEYDTVYGNSAKNGGGVCVERDGKLYLGYSSYNANSNSGTVNTLLGGIRNNSAIKGGGVYAGGAIVMNSGNIDKNAANKDHTMESGVGGGVYLNNGNFYMEGGTIGKADATSAVTAVSYSNYAENDGGGVYVAGNFTMSGGKISYNYAAADDTDSNGGGGVCLNSVHMGDTLEMENDAIISFNGSGKNGGGVCFYNGNSSESNSFTMKDSASIAHNNAKENGGDLYVNADSEDALSFTGGTLTDNTIGAVSATQGSQYYIELTDTSNTYKNNRNETTINVTSISLP